MPTPPGTAGTAHHLNWTRGETTVTTPYYRDDHVTLYLGDCREISEWRTADVLVCDPPYGRGWRQGRLSAHHHADDSHRGIIGDLDTSTRDTALAQWGHRPALVFGDLMLAPPHGTRLVAVYRKPPDAGFRGATGGIRRDAEGIYLVGSWPSGLGGRSSIFTTATRTIGGCSGPAGRTRHPHAKPGDVMETLITLCPPGAIADPFAGSGTTLIAARSLGRHAIGVEIEEKYCELIARRLDQHALPIRGIKR